VNGSLYVNWQHKGAVLALSLIYAIFYLFVFGKLKWLNSKVLLFFAAISYPLSLIHRNLGYFLIKQVEAWGYTGFYIVVLLVFIAIASLITFYVEKPILSFFRLKIKWNTNLKKDEQIL
jgi:peptidoglycan/LPS O-acetylase OafA/YrhL